MFRSVFDADYQGYEVFLDKVLKPLFGEQLEVLPVAEDNPTGVSEEAMEKARIKRIVRVANIAQTFNRDPMEVFDITLEDRVDITRARVGIQQIIRRGLFIHTHAFMLFHAEHPDGENWRFSYAHKLGTVGSMTDAKRYTYLFGENMHCRTAIDRFADLAKGEITNQKLLDAFNVEALSDEFFDEYRKHYAAFVKYITGKYFEKEGGKWVEKSGTPNEELMAQFGGDDKAVRDYVKKLMGRITFLHFLQKKGWMNWDVNYMQHLFEKSDKKDNFLEAVLEPLFFGVLNTKVQNRAALFEQRGWDFDLLDEWQDFPYLNGGLFEEDESDRLNVVFPESYFVDLFKFYARYNFTVDENDPDDAEVGVDPEMLGKIFENLLEDNKDKGAFYTPKEIVRYMCQESLTAYLVGKTGYDEELIRSFVIHPYDEVEKFDNQQQNAIYNALENVKICDPAIGSGAFPMGLLNELVRCEEALLGEREDDHQSRSGLKKYIIQNNIYGVDIEKGAIDIARLRFWLSIVVDEKEPCPLPNLDYKIMQGNSLLESYKKIDLSHLLTEEGIGEDMLGGLFANQDVIQDTREELAASLEAYFNCSDHEEKTRIQEDIRTIIKVQLSARNLNVDFGDIDVAANQEFFLWHTWFSDVFNRPSDCEKGFDIVIGNPPYNELRDLSSSLQLLYSKSKYHKFAQGGRINMFQFFYPLGIDIVNSNGIVSLITQNSLLAEDSALRNRELIFKEMEILHITSFPERDDRHKRVFESAKMSVCIALLKRNKVRTEKPFKVTVWDDRYMDNGKELIISKEEIIRIFGDDLTIPICTQEQLELLCRIKEHGRFESLSSYSGEIDMTKYKPFFQSHYTKDSYRLITGAQIQRYYLTDSPSQGGLKYLYDKDIQISNNRWTFVNSERIVLQRITGVDSMIRIIATLIPAGMVCANSTNFIASGQQPLLCILGCLNSKLINWFFKLTSTNTNVTSKELSKLPIPILPEIAQEEISNLTFRILDTKKNDYQTDTTSIESAIDKIVYSVFGLNEKDIELIESSYK